MTWALLLAIAISSFATLWSLQLRRRFREWRIYILATVLLLVSLRQILTLVALVARPGPELASIAGPTSPVSELIISAAMLLWVTYLQFMLIEREQTQTLYHSMVEILPQNIFRKDLNHRVTFGNRSYCETMGKGLEELVGRDDFDLYPPELAKKYQEDDRRVIETEKSYETVEENQLPSGESIHVQVVKSPVFDASGHICGVQGIFWDITARKRAEHALRESEEKYRILVERANDGICIIQDGQVKYGNQQLEHLGGYSPEEFVDTQYSDYLPPDELSIVAAKYAKHISGEEPTQRYESALIHKDGRRIDVEVNAGLITYDGHRASLVFLRDVTERRRTEQQLRQRDNALAHVTRLSTMGEMVAGIAHEINQPLYAISNYANACTARLRSSEASHSEKLLEWTHQIAEQANRAGEIIRRFGNFARKSSTHRLTVDINLLIPESVELVRLEARRYGVHLDHALTRPLPPVLVDRIQIQQVMVNLLRNACEATADSDIDRRRVVIRTLDFGDSVEVAVEDNGTGLPVTAFDHLFDAFSTTKQEGMGMGLAISRTIVESHDGKIWATNNPDQGATFHFLLPATTKGAQK